jgi:hypothetical protein
VAILGDDEHIKWRKVAATLLTYRLKGRRKVGQHGKKRLDMVPGRPRRIEDTGLRRSRDELRALLVNTWATVRQSLSKIRTAEDVPGAFRVLQDQSSPFLVEVLLRQPETAATTWPDDSRVLAMKLDQLLQRRTKLLDSISESGPDACLPLHHERQQIEQTLKDGYTYFARAEVARFCKSARYRLSPLSTANALAGLPFIGWRQSVKRCSRM